MINNAASPLYFDIETVPDENRLDSFGLEPLPALPNEQPIDACPVPADLLSLSIDGIKAALRGIVPCDEWCTMAISAERAGKGRAGVFAAIAEARNGRQNAIAVHEERRKLLSTTPEYCRLAALGWAEGGGEAQSLVAQSPDDEAGLLDKFWQLVAGSRPVIGFNVIQFDLPVILVRSALLDLPPLRTFELKPWGNVSGVIDLYLGRFGSRGNGNKPGKLKQIAALMGIDVPAGDMDGSQVYDLLHTEPAKVGEYVRSDVAITRAYYAKLQGFFWQ